MQTLTDHNLSVTRFTKGKLPGLPFVSMKNAILGNNYSLSVAFVGTKESHRLNKTYRKKDKPTNILSFPLSKSEGELVICLSQVRKDAPNFDQTYHDFLGFLVIHGMLHLKGRVHGSRMESEEKKFSRQFGFL